MSLEIVEEPSHLDDDQNNNQNNNQLGTCILCNNTINFSEGHSCNELEDSVLAIVYATNDD